ncbi:MAG: PspA/IM30 family protein [Desulfobacteraceae bacterium]|nr:PspA/IM30 family protein [Desulfobacteraceae bacterium]
MANIFKRINNVISSNINNLIDRVEDPERMIIQIIREMESNINRAKEGVIDAIASEKQLAGELEYHRQYSEKWHAKAEAALREKNENLAREAIAIKKDHENIAGEIEISWKAACNTSKNLKAQLRDLEKKLADARRKRSVLIARKRAAEARESMNNIERNNFQKGQNARDKFTRMEDRVLEIEARTQAVAELNDLDAELDMKILKLEADTEVESDLEALKAKIDNELQEPSGGKLLQFR